MHSLFDLIQLLAWIVRINFHPTITRLATRFGHIFTLWYLFPYLRPRGTWVQGICFHFDEDRTTRIFIGLRPDDEFFIATSN